MIDEVIRQRQHKQIKDTTEEPTQSLLTVPYIKGISETIRKIARNYNIKTVFKSSNTIRSHVTKTKPDSTVRKECVYKIPCECVEMYIGETKRPLDI